MQGYDNKSTFLSLETAQHSWFAGLNGSIVLFFEWNQGLWLYI